MKVERTPAATQENKASFYNIKDSLADMRDTVHNRYNKMTWKYFNEIQKKEHNKYTFQTDIWENLKMHLEDKTVIA